MQRRAVRRHRAAERREAEKSGQAPRRHRRRPGCDIRRQKTALGRVSDKREEQREKPNGETGMEIGPDGIEQDDRKAGGERADPALAQPPWDAGAQYPRSDGAGDRPRADEGGPR